MTEKTIHPDVISYITDKVAHTVDRFALVTEDNMIVHFEPIALLEAIEKCPSVIEFHNGRKFNKLRYNCRIERKKFFACRLSVEPTPFNVTNNIDAEKAVAVAMGGKVVSDDTAKQWDVETPTHRVEVKYFCGWMDGGNHSDK